MVVKLDEGGVHLLDHGLKLAVVRVWSVDKCWEKCVVHACAHTLLAKEAAPRVDGAGLAGVLQEGAVLVQEKARGDLGLDGVEEVGEDGQELLERRLGASDLFVCSWGGESVMGVWVSSH